jgi:hypothetical protein
MAKKKTKKEEIVEETITMTVPNNEFELEAEELTMVEKYSQTKVGEISVRPYFNQADENMGLEKYGMILHDEVYHSEQLTCLEVNGVKRYVTGLNEFAPEVKTLPKEKREAKVKEIRRAVAQLEAELAQNILDPEDAEFWNKVKLLRPDNDKLWSKITLKCGNETMWLNPAEDPYDLIKICAIEAGGFSLVASSLEKARSMVKPPKFYLDKTIDTVSTRTTDTKLKNRALAALTNLYDSNPTKLFFLAKSIDVNSSQYIKSMPNDVVYEMMDNYINGYGAESNKRKAATIFVEASKESLEDLKIRSLVRDARQYGFLSSNPDGFIYHADTGTKLGRKNTDVFAFLKNPLNEEITSALLEKCEHYWNR